MSKSLLIRQLGLQPYATTWQAMQDYTDRRDAKSRDEPGYCNNAGIHLGQAGKPEHLFRPGTILAIVRPAAKSPITKPSQMIVCLMPDLRGAKIGYAPWYHSWNRVLSICWPPLGAIRVNLTSNTR
ncbi:hypothetical protein [endosymbiont of Lamellibrachia barhami]|uniref:hypothetical protein n=1 Tax=endosymbiont of Lamellibrachia barhami TaxID=205975 RepID=UPI0015AC7ABF|nr:hypothetical protein [endosymbiont of Lamellibrachia barhami]